MRLLRVLRLVRLVRSIKPLFVLLTGVVKAMRAMSWVMILTFFLLYSMSILFTSLVGHGMLFDGDREREPDGAREAFATVWLSFYSPF